MTIDPTDPQNQNLADQAARLTRLESTVQAHWEQLEELRDRITPSPGPDEQPGLAQDGRACSPTFLLLLDDELLEQELALLSMWVQEILVPYYVAEPTSLLPWCPWWWKHPTAQARLHGLWRAWQECTDPDAGGHTGPAIWHRDYLDSTLAVLRAPDGPFAGCTTDPRRLGHREETPASVEPYPA
jgi:hypothetical protein